MGIFGKKAVEPPLSSKEYTELSAQILDLTSKLANLKAEFTGMELEIAYLKNKSLKIRKKEEEESAFNTPMGLVKVV